MKYCFGVDIGGTTVKMGLFQADGVLGWINGRLRQGQRIKEKRFFRILQMPLQEHCEKKMGLQERTWKVSVLESRLR